MFELVLGRRLRQMRDQQAGRWGITPRIGSPMKSMLHGRWQQGGEVAAWKAATRLCRPLIVEELKISVEQGRVVTILNIIKC